MYKNIHFLSVKFIIISSQIYSLSECFTAKEVEKRQNYYKIATFLEIFVLQVHSEKLFAEISHPRKWRKWLGSRKLRRPHRHPAHRATPAARECGHGMWARKAAHTRDVRSHDTPAMLPPKALTMHQSSPLPRRPASEQGGQWGPETARAPLEHVSMPCWG